MIASITEWAAVAAAITGFAWICRRQGWADSSPAGQRREKNAAAYEASMRECERRLRIRAERGHGAELVTLLPAEAEAFGDIAARVRFPEELAARIADEISNEEAA